MSSFPVGRRFFLSGLAASAGAAWLAASPGFVRAAGADAARALRDDPWRVLSPHEAELLDAVTEQIFPTDDTPGAREARVVRFIDQSLATYAASELPLLRRGLGELEAVTRRRHPDAASFAALPAADQTDILRAFEAVGSTFFESVRMATITGMFANPEYGGNFEKAGWRLIGFEDRFSWGPPFGDYDRG